MNGAAQESNLPSVGWEERLERLGVDTSDLGGVAADRESLGYTRRELPPITLADVPVPPGRGRLPDRLKEVLRTPARARVAAVAD